MISDILKRNTPDAPLIRQNIGTSTAQAALGYTNQRKLDRCSNGVLWATFWNGTATVDDSFEFWYSEDDGYTWNQDSSLGFAGTGATKAPSSSFFIDIDDFAHLVYIDRHDGNLRYRRGTPNASRTAWTWSNALLLITSNNENVAHPDIVAHPHGVGWVAHIVVSYVDTENVSRVFYQRIDISSIGVISKNTSDAGFVSENIFSVGHVKPSIDFQHINDAKTPAVYGPFLVIGWSYNDTGETIWWGGTSEQGCRYSILYYSSAKWFDHFNNDIDYTLMMGWKADGTGRWYTALFDGTMFFMGGLLTDTTGPNESRAFTVNPLTGKGGLVIAGVGMFLKNGSISHTDKRAVYSIGQTVQGFQITKWDRYQTDGKKWDVTLTGSDETCSASAKRGCSNGRFEFLLLEGTSAPRTISFGSKLAT